MVLTAQSHAASVQAFARRVGSDGAISPVSFAKLDPDALVEAALLDESLDVLGLVEGPIQIVPRDQGRTLPSDAKLYRTALDGAWTNESTASAGLRELRYLARVSTAAPSCTTFGVTRFSLPTRASAYRVFPAGNAGWLIVMKDKTDPMQPVRDFLLLDPSTQRAVRPAIQGAIATATVSAAYGEPDGSVYLGADHGQIWRLTSFDPLEAELLSEDPSEARVVDMAGGTVSSTGAHEVFTLTFGGQIDRFDGTLRTHLFVFPGGQVLRIGPRELLGVSPVSSGVLDLRVGAPPVTERVDAAGGMVSLSNVSGFGPLAGTVRGEILNRAMGLWSARLGASPLTVDVNIVAPWAGGFLAAGTGGFVAQYGSGGYCPLFQPVAFDVEVIQTTSAGLLVLGDVPAAESSAAGAILTP
jgi:hypothetical protein